MARARWQRVSALTQLKFQFAAADLWMWQQQISAAAAGDMQQPTLTIASSGRVQAPCSASSSSAKGIRRWWFVHHPGNTFATMISPALSTPWWTSPIPPLVDMTSGWVLSGRVTSSPVRSTSQVPTATTQVSSKQDESRSEITPAHFLCNSVTLNCVQYAACNAIQEGYDGYT